jgi:S1-C subfamily serine protease
MTASNLRLFPLRQVSSHALAVALSIALTVTTLRVFPSLLLLKPQSEVIPTDGLITLDADRSFVVNVVDQVGASVVHIDTEGSTAKEFPNSLFNNPFLQKLFGKETFSGLLQGIGTGFIIERNGTILTNAHVVSDANSVKVTLKDGRVFRGYVREVDKSSDLAVVKIQGQKLPVAPLGDSKDLHVGEWAIALGNPSGQGNTVTLGIISAVTRSNTQVTTPDKQPDFIQTDAAINSGNSGGPLLNARGEVIGINTTTGAEAQGFGFAVPIDKAKVIKDLTTN